jgi:hypothetical protein
MGPNMYVEPFVLGYKYLYPNTIRAYYG